MSAPEPTGTRQRTNKTDKKEDETANPASLSADPTKKVPRNKPYVKPPFIDMSMNRFLSYLVLSLLAIGAFYAWRFTVWAADAGGYWNLMTGRRPPLQNVNDPAAIASAAASAAQSGSAAGASSAAGRGGSSGKSSNADIQSQIFNLANALGIKPAELSSAIRPLIDPSVPNPAAAAQQEAEVLKQAAAAQGTNGGGESQQTQDASVLGILGEALLD